MLDVPVGCFLDGFLQGILRGESKFFLGFPDVCDPAFLPHLFYLVGIEEDGFLGEAASCSGDDAEQREHRIRDFQCDERFSHGLSRSQADIIPAIGLRICDVDDFTALQVPLNTDVDGSDEILHVAQAYVSVRIPETEENAFFDESEIMNEVFIPGPEDR